MAQQVADQLDFADSLISNNPNLNQRLDKIDQLVNWRSFEQLLNSIYSYSMGRPSYPLLLLFKCLLIQQWYAVSDYVLEEMLDDRLSFRVLWVFLSHKKHQIIPQLVDFESKSFHSKRHYFLS